MCMWTRAMHTYYFVAKEVEPKKAALKGAQEELKETNKLLDAANSRLKAVNDRIAALEAALKAAVDKMEQLNSDVERANVQLSNADKLLGGLGAEAIRWKMTVKKLQADQVSLLNTL